VLHESVSALCAQALPPDDGAVALRERLMLPAPHDAVHALHAPHAPSEQSVAHACTLHACVSALCGHALPPDDGAVTLRDRVMLPAPHVVVHVLQDVHVPFSQSTAQACLLHACRPSAPSSPAAHARPPFACDVLTAKYRY
jgi:hypothetical protein